MRRQARQSDADTIAIGLGDDVTCTITNDDNAPSLTLVKDVTNDNGGDRRRRPPGRSTATRPDRLRGHDPGAQRRELRRRRPTTCPRPARRRLHGERLGVRRRQPVRRRHDRPRPRRRRHLHDHQRRRRAVADPGQGRHQRQRRDQVGDRLDADRDRPDRLAATTPALSGAELRRRHLHAVARPAVAGYTASAWVVRSGGTPVRRRHGRPRPRRRRHLHDHQRRPRADADPGQGRHQRQRRDRVGDRLDARPRAARPASRRRPRRSTGRASTPAPTTLTETGLAGYTASAWVCVTAAAVRRRHDRHRPRRRRHLHDHQRRHPADAHGHQGPRSGERPGPVQPADRRNLVRDQRRQRWHDRCDRHQCRQRTPSTRSAARYRRHEPGQLHDHHRLRERARSPASSTTVTLAVGPEHDLHHHQHRQGRRRRRHPGLPRLHPSLCREPRRRPDRHAGGLPAAEPPARHAPGGGHRGRGQRRDQHVRQHDGERHHRHHDRLRRQGPAHRRLRSQDHGVRVATNPVITVESSAGANDGDTGPGKRTSTSRTSTS